MGVLYLISMSRVMRDTSRVQIVSAFGTNMKTITRANFYCLPLQNCIENVSRKSLQNRPLAALVKIKDRKYGLEKGMFLYFFFVRKKPTKRIILIKF